MKDQRRIRGPGGLPVMVILSLLVACTTGNDGAPTGTRVAVDDPLDPSGWTVVAQGLDNPRGLAFAPSGALYVAEAGRGGDGPCFEGPEGDEVCFGLSGAVTEVWKGMQARIVEGLPSIAAPDGSAAGGPHDVSPQGSGSLYVTLGLGASAAGRAALPPEGAIMGTLVRVTAGSGKWSVEADLAAFEAAFDPDAGLPSAEEDSNPYGVAAGPSGALVSDAGGNDLIWVHRSGAMALVAVLPFTEAPAPDFLGLPEGTMLPVQPVPTGVAEGPDGAWYVGELTGFPFPVGEADVFRVEEGGMLEVYAEGFTNIIDVAFGPEGELYVLEIATHGLLSGDPTGALWRVSPGGDVSLVASEGLVMPGGVAVDDDGAIYVSNCGVCPGGGAVVRIEP